MDWAIGWIVVDILMVREGILLRIFGFETGCKGEVFPAFRFQKVGDVSDRLFKVAEMV